MASSIGIALLSTWMSTTTPIGAGAPPVDTDGKPWELVESANEMAIYRKKTGSNPVFSLKGVAVIDAPMSKVLNSLVDEQHATEWFDGLVEARKVKQLSPTEYVEYRRMGVPPLIMTDRDFVTHVKIESATHDKEKGVELKAWSVEEPSQPEGKYVRGKVILSKFFLRPIEGGTKTLVDAELHADPKGSAPRWLINWYQESWPRNTIEKLKKFIARSDVRERAEFSEMLKK